MKRVILFINILFREYKSWPIFLWSYGSFIGSRTKQSQEESHVLFISLCSEWLLQWVSE